ncbi:MAG TPA: hypothetical protein VH301_16295 [Usitatibacter sp.]|nr:hypothetical protein [Usitatibacter sp.]
MVTWYRLLDNAKSSLEVVAAARDYLATLTPEEIGRLPTGVRPGKLRDERDIEELHARLVEEYRGSKATGQALDVLQRLTTFMVRAAIRISELSDPRPKGEPGGGSSEPKNAAPRSKH